MVIYDYKMLLAALFYVTLVVPLSCYEAVSIKAIPRISDHLEA